MKLKMVLSALIVAMVMVFTDSAAHAQYSFNHALRLDGNGDYVQVGGAPTITNQLLVEAWIKTSVATGDQTIIGRYNHFSSSLLDDQFILSVHNGKPRFQINPGNVYFILDGNRFVADGQWHHVAGIFGCSTMTLFVDGVNDSQKNTNVPCDTTWLNNPPTTPLRIGASSVNGSPGFFFNGLIDEVHLWDKILRHHFWPYYAYKLPIRDRSGAYPLAAWRFNTDPTDTGYNATLKGNAFLVPTSDVPLNSNSALVLGGTWGERDKGYLTIPSGNALTPSNKLTIEAQVNALPEGHLQALVSKFRHNSNSITDDAYFLGIEANGVARFQVSVGNNWRMVQGTTNLYSGGWHHVAGVFDGQWLYLYVDGGLEASAPLVGSFPSNNTPLYIGASQDGPSGVTSYLFKGVLDDVRIWHVARSQTEINNGKAGQLSNTTGLVARWLFEGDFINIVNRTGLHPRYWAVPAGTPELVRFCKQPCAGADVWLPEV